METASPMSCLAHLGDAVQTRSEIADLQPVVLRVPPS
jgi:hypothetical protein